MDEITDVGAYIFSRAIVSVILIVILAFAWDMLMAGPFSEIAYLLLFLATPGPELLYITGAFTVGAFLDDGF